MARWYYTVNGKKHGPVSDQILRKLARNGCLQPEDFVWKSGLKEWARARRLKGLFQPVKAGEATPRSTSGGPQTAPGFQPTNLMVLKKGTWVGPYQPEAIHSMLANGEVLPTDQVRLEVWMPAGSVGQLLPSTPVASKATHSRATAAHALPVAQPAKAQDKSPGFTGMALAAAGGAVVGAATAKLLGTESRPSKKGHRSRQGSGLVNRLLGAKRKGIARSLFRDANRDGITDTIVTDVNRDGIMDTIGMDFDQDGVLDAVGVDINQDGILDAVGVDVDADGVLDAIGVDTDGDGLLDAVTETDGEAAGGIMEGIFGLFGSSDDE